MLAAVEGSVVLGKLLLERGANPLAANAKQQTALTIATARGHNEFVDLLSAQA